VSTPNVDALIGQTIGSYVVVSRVGGGGMGVVYQARDTRLGRTVALKFLPPQWSHDEEARQRFVREAQAASATNHPNICTIHDIETAPDGQLFIVMAYYEGQTLKQRLASGPLSVDDALDIATQIADGLAKAHAQGVVHRDIKPGNVMITEDGVRIVDFGLATFADALKLTVEHSTLGTAAYMSPEQVRGLAADARSDVWAVGVILYEMLAGHVPFQGSHAEAIAYAVRNETPASIRASRPEVAEEIEHVVFRAMHKEPSVRFTSGRELARALRQVRGLSIPIDFRTEQVAVPKPVAPVDKKRSPRKLLAGVAAAVLVIGSTWTWLAWPVERVAIAVAPFSNQTGDSDLEQYRLALTQTLTLSLEDSRDLQVTPYGRVLEVLRRFIQQKADVSNRDAIQVITASTGAALVVVPTLLRDGGAWSARVELRDPRTSNSVWVHQTEPRTSSLTRDVAFRLAMVLADDIDTHLRSPRTAAIKALTWVIPSSRQVRPGRARTLDVAKAFADGTAAYEDLEYAVARKAFRAAVDLDPRNPLLLAWLSRAAQLAKEESEATEAAARIESTVTDETADVDALFAEAVSAEARREMQAAERAYRALTDRRPGDPAWTMELAGFFDRQAQNADAVAMYHAALTQDPRLVRPRLELCRLYSPSRLNELADAKTHGQAALTAYQAIGARGGEAQSLLCLADTLVVGTDEEKVQAQSYAKAAEGIFNGLGYDYNAARAEYYLALVAGSRGQLTESISLGQGALARAQSAGNLAVQATVMNNLGAAYVLSGERQKAADFYQQAYKLYQSWHDETRAARIQANRGALLIEYGNPEEGILDVRNALTVTERLGDRRYQTFCLRVIATYCRNQGRLSEAIRELNRGLAIAKERNLADNVTVMTTLLALSQFDSGDYDSARQSLLEALKGGTGRRSTEARIRLARTYVYLGDRAAAERELQLAAQELDASPNEELRSLISLVRAEWEMESQRSREARAHLEEGTAAWNDALPEPSAVEARAYLGFLLAADGQLERGRQLIVSSVEAAGKLQHVALEARCRLFLASIEIGRGRLKEANELLNSIPEDNAERTLSPELRAEVHASRGRLQAARGDVDASTWSLDAARTTIRRLAERLPENYRSSFAAREAIKRFQR
jgi:serine/threonine protein kinase/tetratricopeptide (TPR) repeat protein